MKSELTPRSKRWPEGARPAVRPPAPDGPRMRHRPSPTGRAVAVAVLVAVLAGALAGPALARIRFTGVAGSAVAGVASADEGLWFSSSTHRDWQEATGAGPGRTYTAALAASTGFFFALAEDGTIWRSGTTLGSGFVPAATVGAGLRALTETSGRLLAVGDAGYIGRSSDLTGESWVPLASATSRDLFAVASNGLTSTVAVGEAGAIVRAGLGSTDWQPVAIAESRTFRGLTVDANGRYLAVGDGGAAWRSDASGLNWESLDFGFTVEANLRAASRVGQVVVVVGDAQTILYSPANLAGWQVRTAPSVDGAGTYDLLAVAGTGTPDWIAVGSGRATIWSQLGLQWSTNQVTPVLEESWGRIKGRFRD